jgi:copper(I)-binding protein
MLKFGWLLLMAVLMMIAGAVFAQDDQPLVFAHDAWVRPTAAEASATVDMTGVVTGAFMLVENRGESGVRLVSAASPVAGLVEVHETTMDGDVMRMNRVEGIDVPAGETLELRPRSYHIMLFELDAEILPGDALPIVLTFEREDGDPFEITVGALATDEVPVVGDLVVTGAWARPTLAERPEGADMTTAEPTDAVSAAYMMIENRGNAADRLIGAASPAAGIVEIHETTMDGDVMRMNRIDGLDIPAGEAATLAPRGYHIMLMELVDDLYPGDAIALTLTFESGAEITIGVPIYDAMPPMR